MTAHVTARAPHSANTVRVGLTALYSGPHRGNTVFALCTRTVVVAGIALTQPQNRAQPQAEYENRRGVELNLCDRAKCDI